MAYFMHAIVLYSIEFYQQPWTQHILVGDSASFSCSIDEQSAELSWDVIFSNGSRKHQFDDSQLAEGIDFHSNLLPNGNEVITLTFNSTGLRFNNTEIRCNAYFRGKRDLSDIAFLFIYTSLRTLDLMCMMYVLGHVIL